MFVAHLIRQKGDGGGGGLRLGAAAGERGVVVQVILLGKIAQGEAISKDDGPAGQRVEKVPELLIQHLDLPGVVLAPDAEGLRVLRIQLSHGPGNVTDDLGGIPGRRPHMLVVLLDLAQLLLVVMVVVALHALHGLLLQKIHAVHELEGAAGGLRRREDGVHPGIGLAAQVQKQVALLHRQNVRRRGLIGMALRPRRQQQRYLHVLAAAGAGKIVSGEHRRHDLQRLFSILRRLGGLLGAAAGQQQGTQQHPAKSLFQQM